MRALVKLGFDKTETVVRDIPNPSLQDGQVLLRVEACGLCGSDIHAWRSDKGYEWVKAPVTLGHEFVGSVVEVSSDVSDWKIGDRAVVVSIQGCLTCDECERGMTERCASRKVIGLSYDGAMAEFVSVSARYLVRIPSSIPAIVGAAVEPLSVSAHATLTTGQVESGQKVVVSGAGFVGIGCALLAKDVGAEVILIGAERDRALRLPAAEKLGIETRIFGKGSYGSPDLWIEASGAASALASAVVETKTGGKISVVGLYGAASEADINQLVRREITLKGSYASVAKEYELIIDLMQRGRLEVESLLEQFSLEDGLDAFNSAEKSQTIKPVIVPN